MFFQVSWTFGFLIFLILFFFGWGAFFYCFILDFLVLALFFYVCFELIFVCMFFFLLGWGYSPERLQASFYMIFYTLVVSFPFLVYLVLFMTFSTGKFLFWGEMAGYFWLRLVFVFLVKLPVYGVHL